MELTLEQLKDIAKKVDFAHHHNIGKDRLEQKLIEHCNEIGTSIEEVSKSLNITFSTDNNTVTNIVPKKVDTYNSIESLKTLRFSKTGTNTVKAKQSLEEKKKEAMKLIRCTITCNNKNKTSYTGDVFAVRNAVMPEYKKFVSFNTPTHVPQILLNSIKETKYQMFRKIKHPNGSETTKSYLVDEYNVTMLPPLTKEEREAIRQKQIAEGFNGE
jgi:hypothetical protein